MFDLKELMNNIDLGDVLSKFNLGDEEKKKVTESALEAVTYRTKKETGKGNANVLENLFSQDSNTTDADNVAKNLEGDLAYSLQNKAGMSSGVVDSIKSAVMSKVLAGFMNTGGKGGKGILDGLLNSDMLSGFLGGDSKSNSKEGGMMDTISNLFGK
jgi:hypothetical protein